MAERDPLDIVIDSLMSRFGRLPTEDEVIGFIMGTQEQREAIYNKEVP